MATLRQILVATDFGPSSERAVETAAALATRFAAELTVAHVIDGGAFAFPVARALRQAARTRLDATVAGLRARRLTVGGVLREGVPWEEICASATEASADLVVVGSHGRRGAPRLLLGSVAERVIRLSPAPVLTVRPSGGALGESPAIGGFRHILAPTDLGAVSERGIDAAVSLAIELDSALTIVHAYELPNYAYFILEEVAASAEEQLRLSLEEQLARVRPRMPRVEGVLRQGDPCHVILDVAKARQADLIVLSTHGRQGLPRALLGSVAEKIARTSSLPILTIGSSSEWRGPGAGAEKRAFREEGA
jgi:nucleotide-binding universal stress UspA family protein